MEFEAYGKSGRDIFFVFGDKHQIILIVVAEGVENERELEMLRSYGCNCAQGFLVSQPLSESEFIDFIRAASAVRA